MVVNFFKFPMFWNNFASRCNLTSKLLHNKFFTSAGRKEAVKLSYISQENFVERDGRPPVIVLHGLFGSKRNWESMSKALNRALHQQVIAVDCRNHGLSPHVNDMDFMLMSEDIVNLMEDLSIPKVDLIGHSMGGKVAMVLALTKPDLVSKLIVVDVSPSKNRLATNTSFPTYLDAMKNVTMDNSLSISKLRRSAANQMQHVFKPQEMNFITSNIVEQGSSYGWQINLDSIERNLDKVVAFPDLNQQYHDPCLFIAGQKSTSIREENHNEIKRLFPNFKLKTIGNAGHWVHAEQPYEFQNAVVQFLRR